MIRTAPKRQKKTSSQARGSALSCYRSSFCAGCDPGHAPAGRTRNLGNGDVNGDRDHVVGRDRSDQLAALQILRFSALTQDKAFTANWMM